MANLLPLDYKAKLKRKERSAFVFTLSFLLFGAAVVAAVALAPSYVVLVSQTAPVNVPAAPSDTAQADQKVMDSAKQLLDQVAPFAAATTSAMQEIGTILARKPAGLSVERISYVASDGTAPAQLMLSGSASKPQDISTFRSALATLQEIQNVSLPVDALVGLGSGQYSVTITGTF